jgi:hypothetical protein
MKIIGYFSDYREAKNLAKEKDFKSYSIQNVGRGHHFHKWCLISEDKK